MEHIVAYIVGPQGKVRVRLSDGNVRNATDSEWLAIWRSVPQFTLQVAAR